MMIAQPPGPLNNIGVLVTRPRHQAEPLLRQIEAAGGRALHLPLIEIVGIEEQGSGPATLDRLGEFHIAIFISVNAVEWGLRTIQRRGGLPPRLQLAAVGKATAQALEERGLGPVLQPRQRYDSEGLLALPEFQPEALAGCRVLIFRGAGGREWLADNLQHRGASVQYAEVYRRTKPSGNAPLKLPDRSVEIILVSSGEGLRNLWEMLDAKGQAWLSSCPLIVPGERVAAIVRELGLPPPLVAENASDAAMLAALLAWRQKSTEPRWSE
jgi:uroporphyrinogen-III synthase